jgi:outer membrane protein TolC
LYVSIRSTKLTYTVMVAMLALACAGCTRSRSVGDILPASTAPKQDELAAPAARAWWREAGDPLLAALVEQGLDANPEIACRISGLQQHDLQAAREAKEIGARLGRLLGADKKAIADGQARTRDERLQRVAARRARLARQIALAYVEVRRLQQIVALRSGLIAQYKDNAEIAQFRREAGLVSAVDGALARAQDQAAQGELDFSQRELGEAISQLADLVGDTSEVLVARLKTPDADPGSPVDTLAKALAGDAPQVELADDVAREARLTQALEEARRTVGDVRTAYRQGATVFATLYVAEAAATTVDLALVNAKAGRVSATLNLRSGQDAAWAREGLAPVLAADSLANDRIITVTADCD